MTERTQKLVVLTCLTDEAFANTVTEKTGSLESELLRLSDEGITDSMCNMIECFRAGLTNGKSALVEAVAGIYEANFSEEEQDELIRLYESPIWKKIMAVSPVLQESIIEAQSRWISGAQQEIRDDLLAIFKVAGLAPKTEGGL